MSRDSLNIMIGGEAGQGLVTHWPGPEQVPDQSGYHILVTQDYMSGCGEVTTPSPSAWPPRELDSPSEGWTCLSP